MICREVLDRLDDYLDDALSDGERRRVEEHLSACDGCRSELASIGALLDTSQDLQKRRFEPGRDLWPEIHRRIGDPSVRAERSRRVRLGPGSPRFIWQFAAAAVVLAIAIGFGYPVVFHRPLFRGSTMFTERSATSPTDPGAAGLSQQLALLHSQVSSTRAEVTHAATADSSAGSSWKVFDENLQVLDQAIRDSRAALAQDPDNPVLQKSILSAYQKQLELLRWASRLVRQV